MLCAGKAYVPNGKLTFKIIVNEFKKLLVLYILFFNVLNTYFLKNRNYKDWKSVVSIVDK